MEVNNLLCLPGLLIFSAVTFLGEYKMHLSPTHIQWNSTRWALINKRVKLREWLNSAFCLTNTRCLSNGVPSWAGARVDAEPALDTDLTHVFIQSQLPGSIYYRPVVLDFCTCCEQCHVLSPFCDKMRTTASFHVYFTSCCDNTCQTSVVVFVGVINNNNRFFF